MEYIVAALGAILLIWGIIWFVRRRRNATKEIVILGQGGSIITPTQPVTVPVQPPTHVVYTATV
jgi:hypothetical protein